MHSNSFNAKKEAFRNSCHCYINEKRTIEQFGRHENDSAKQQLVRYMQEDIDYVDGVFDRIAKLCGTNARLIIWNLYVEEKIQTDVASQFGISRRQLQYNLNKWLHLVFDEEE